MRKLTTIAVVFTLGFTWALTPALADEMKKPEAGKAETGQDTTTRARGSDEIRQTQQALKDKGFDPGPIDGQMGPRTRAALIDYQMREKLTATGRLDSKTKEQLLSAPAASPRTDSSAKP
jgi:peptidoglycan hydrolase-like protein with peptidoglycan-binding domain